MSKAILLALAREKAAEIFRYFLEGSKRESAFLGPDFGATS